MPDDLTRHDRRRRRCPMLGHPVDFSYCRAPGRELPCGKVFDCWWESFDVEGFIRAHLSPDQIARMLAPGPAKLTTLVDLIDKARKARGDDT